MDNFVIPLPTDIVEHIQSCMNPKDAARSAVLCKQLYTSWSQSKSVEFDQRFFRHAERFWAYATDTLQRYIDSSLKLEIFTLRVLSGSERYRKTKQLIEMAAILGAVEINLEFHNTSMIFQIPEKVFSSNCLDKISVRGGTFVVGAEMLVNRSKVKTLRVHPDAVIGHVGDFVSHYLLKCPSLVHLNCDAFLVSFDFGRVGNTYHSLETLRLINLRNKNSQYFADILGRFPRLRTLSLHSLYGCPTFRICSDTLESISIAERYRQMVVELNVPKLRRFRFEGVSWSTFCFESHCPEWVCDVSIMCGFSSAKWFSSLRELLPCFNESTLLLSVCMQYDQSSTFIDLICDGSPHQIEALAIQTLGPTPGLLDSLLRICRPKFINYNGTVTTYSDYLPQDD